MNLLSLLFCCDLDQLLIKIPGSLVKAAIVDALIASSAQFLPLGKWFAADLSKLFFRGTRCLQRFFGVAKPQSTK